MTDSDMLLLNYAFKVIVSTWIALNKKKSYHKEH